MGLTLIPQQGLFAQIGISPSPAVKTDSVWHAKGAEKILRVLSYFLYLLFQ
jgi:hypothetical protein